MGKGSPTNLPEIGHFVLDPLGRIPYVGQKQVQPWACTICGSVAEPTKVTTLKRTGTRTATAPIQQKSTTNIVFVSAAKSSTKTGPTSTVQAQATTQSASQTITTTSATQGGITTSSTTATQPVVTTSASESKTVETPTTASATETETQSTLTTTVTPTPYLSIQNSSTSVIVNGSTPSLADGTDFGIVPLYDALGQQILIPGQGTFKLSNTAGTGPLIISNITINYVSGCYDAFYLNDTNLIGKELAPGESIDMVIDFFTSKFCLDVTDATVVVESNDNMHSPYSFDVRCQGQSGLLTDSSTGFVSMITPVNVSATTNVTFTSAGNLPIVLNCSAGASGSPEITFESLPIYMTLNPTESVVVNVTLNAPETMPSPPPMYNAAIDCFIDTYDEWHVTIMGALLPAPIGPFDR